jgi:hypothetical protein
MESVETPEVHANSVESFRKNSSVLSFKRCKALSSFEAIIKGWEYCGEELKTARPLLKYDWQICWPSTIYFQIYLLSPPMFGGHFLYSQHELAPFRDHRRSISVAFNLSVIYLYDTQDQLKYCSLRYVVVSNHDIIEWTEVLVQAINEWLGVRSRKLEQIA